jgi:polar amino acid transport system substrate-binding protein
MIKWDIFKKWFWNALKCFLFLGFLSLVSTSELAKAEDLQPQASKDTKLKGHRTIQLSTPFPDTVPTHQSLKAIYTNAFKRMGYDFEMVYHPPERELLEVNSGNLHGIAGRIFELAIKERYRNIIRVEEPVLFIQFIALCMNPLVKIHGWESLKGFKITYEQGTKYFENNVYKYIDKEDIIVASDFKQAFRLLKSGRVDIYLEVEDAMVFVRLVPEFKNLSFYKAGDVGESTLYPYMHRKNRELAMDLATTLRTMKADGSYNELLDKGRRK